MEYAVTLISGKQLRVVLGQILSVFKISGEKGTKIVFDKTLLFRTDQSTQIGNPYLENFLVEAEVLEQLKGPKIDVHKFKSKVRYRRKTGFREQLTKIKIISIGNKKEKPEAEKKLVVKKKIIAAKTVNKPRKTVKKTK